MSYIVKWIFAGLVAAALAVGGGLELWHLHTTFTELEKDTQALYVLVEENRDDLLNDEVTTALDELMEKWRKEEKVLQLSLSQIPINDLAMRFVSLESHIRQDDYKMANTDLMMILDSLNLIKRFYEPTLDNLG